VRWSAQMPSAPIDVGGHLGSARRVSPAAGYGEYSAVSGTGDVVSIASMGHVWPPRPLIIVA
jgi:hypothetical protein